jgi:hypothetical protein
MSVITDGRVTDAAFRLACYIAYCATEGEWSEDISKATGNLSLSPRTYYRLKQCLLESGIIAQTNAKGRYSVIFSSKTEKIDDNDEVEELPAPKIAKSGTDVSQATEIPLKRDPAFERFYESYPRKIGRRAAEKAYSAAIKRGASHSALQTAAEAYLGFTSERRTETHFIPHPATWLNADRWEDDDLKPFVGRAPASEGDLAPQTI